MLRHPDAMVGPDERTILDLAKQPISLAELSAHQRMVIGVVRASWEISSPRADEKRDPDHEPTPMPRFSKGCSMASAL
jgi:hypothetical protein